MDDTKYPGATAPPPVYQTQPGYGPPYQGAPPPGYQGYPPGYLPSNQGGYQAGAPPDYRGYQGSSAPPGYQTVPTTTTVVVRGGNCPACNIGNTNTEFTILGICLAILFFPIGILCCLLLTEKRCNNCGMTYT